MYYPLTNHAYKISTMKKELIIIFVCFCILVFVFPFYSDDWKFSEANNIKECVEKTIAFYNNWNGRIIPNFFGFWIVSLWPNWLYAVWTSIIITCYVALIKNISDAKIPLTLIAVMLFLLPEPFQCYFWRIGNMNYLYAALFLMLSIWLYEKSDSSEFNKTAMLNNALVGFLTGITHEAVSLPLLGSVIIHTYIKRGTNRCRIALIAGLTVGTLINVLCPGTFVRSSGVQPAAFFNISKFLFSEISTAWFSIITIILLWLLKRRGRLRNFYQTNSFLIILWVVNVLFLFALSIKSISVDGRVIYFQEAIAFIITLKIVDYLHLLNKIKHISTISISLFIMTTFILGIVIWNLKVNTEQELLSLKEGNDEVVKADFLPIEMDETSPDNTCFCRLYNRKSIIGLKGDIYNDIYINNKLSIAKAVLIEGEKWYNYSNVFIREIPDSCNVTDIQYTSIPVVKFAPDFVNDKLATIQKHAKCDYVTITNPQGKKYLLVDIGGNTDFKRVISIKYK